MTEDRNLLGETIDVLYLHGKRPDGVKWVGSQSGELCMSWDDFAKISDVKYHAGFGGQAIASDLVVVGDDWWIERHEYDGSEWWEFKTLPSRAVAVKMFTTVKRDYAEDMCEEGEFYSLSYIQPKRKQET